MSEEKRMNEQQGAAGPAGDKTMDELLNQHMGRWQQRVWIIVAGLAAFLLYMVWFMMHE